MFANNSFKQFLDEQDEQPLNYDNFDPIVIAPGRFNPPHRGHNLLIDTLKKLAEKYNAEPYVFVIDSGKYGEKNPLDGETRKKYLQMMYPDMNFMVFPNAFEAVATMASDYQKVPVGGVSGSDRADSYKKIVGRIFDEQAKEHYDAEVLQRDPDASDIAGISATKVRQAAADGDVAKFKSMIDLPDEQTEQLYRKVREGMGVG